MKNNGAQGDLFLGTEYERTEDLDPAKEYRELLATLDIKTSIDIILKDKKGTEITMSINEDSIEELRSTLSDIKKLWK